MEAWKRFWWTFDDGQHCNECGSTTYEGPRWERWWKLVLHASDLVICTSIGFVAGVMCVLWCLAYVTV